MQLEARCSVPSVRRGPGSDGETAPGQRQVGSGTWHCMAVENAPRVSG